MHQVLRYLQILKHQERLNDINKGMRDDYGDCKTLNKTRPL